MRTVAAWKPPEGTRVHVFGILKLNKGNRVLLSGNPSAIGLVS